LPLEEKTGNRCSKPPKAFPNGGAKVREISGKTAAKSG
jgi:hypothetical protein